MLYMVSVKSTHLDLVHYNNRPTKMIKIKLFFMNVESSKIIFAYNLLWKFDVEMEKQFHGSSWDFVRL